MQGKLRMLGPRQKNRRVFAAMMAGIVVFAALGLTGCGTPTPRPTPSSERAPTGTDGLPFRTVAQAAPLGTRPSDPAYSVMVKPDVQARLEVTFPTDALEAGETAVRDDGTLALLAFGGVKATSGYQVAVEEIRRAGERLVVTVIEHGPEADDKVEPAMTLPYHVVAVTREEIPDAVTRVVFEDESGRVLNQAAYPLP